VASLWTPDGERAAERPSTLGPAEEAVLEAELGAVQADLIRTPVEVVIANHVVGIFQLAALHLNQRPPDLEEGRLAIDAMAALVEGLTGRLGEDETTLREALAQLRLAYVELTQRQ
jgi:hypothetical protein